MAWTIFYGPDAFTGTQYTALPTYSAAWTAGSGTWRISTNGTSAGGPTGGGDMRVYLTTGPATSNHACEFTQKGAGPFLWQQGLLVRWTDQNIDNAWRGTGYACYLGVSGDPTIYINRADGGGSTTNIHASAYSPANGDVLRIEAVGSDLNILKNGTNIYSGISDATYSSGTVGMLSFIGLDDTFGMSVDDFTAYEESAAAATLTFTNRFLA